jgi:hypothetical protein
MYARDCRGGQRETVFPLMGRLTRTEGVALIDLYQCDR